jgi:general secretion pathway protein I
MRFFLFRPKSLISRQNGFTLIETLVAIMILSISLVVIMQLFSGGLKAGKLSDDYLNGIFHAREKMEELLMSGNLLPGTYSGAFEDGYQWAAVLDIAENPAETEEEAAISEKMPVMLVTINLAVTWTSGLREKSYRLSTATLIDKQPVTEETRDV